MLTKLLWRCVGTENVEEQYVRVVERHRLTGRYRTRTVYFDDRD